MKGFHTIIKNVLLSSSTDVGSHNPPSFEASVLAGIPLGANPLQGPASSSTLPSIWLDTISNGSSPPLADIVLFGLPLKVLKNESASERFSHFNKECLDVLSNWCGISRGFLNQTSYSTPLLWHYFQFYSPYSDDTHQQLRLHFCDQQSSLNLTNRQHWER